MSHVFCTSTYSLFKMALFNQNPFTWDNTSKTITSNVVDIVLRSNLNLTFSNLSDEIAITVARDSSQFPEPDAFYLKPSETNETAKTKEYLKFHCFTRSSNWTSMNFQLHPEELGIHFKVYMKKGGKPDIKNGDFEFSFDLPNFNGCSVNSEEVFNSPAQFNESQNNVSQLIHIDPYKNCLKHPYTVFLSNTDFNGTGQYCFGKYMDILDLRFFLMIFVFGCLVLESSFPFIHSLLSCLA